jgi:hypothetical protein
MLTLVMVTPCAPSSIPPHRNLTAGSQLSIYLTSVTYLESALSKDVAPKSFIMRTYVKSQNNPFRMRTYKKTRGVVRPVPTGSKFASPNSTAMERAIKSKEMTSRLRLFRRTTIPSSPANGPSKTRALRPTFK